VSTAYRQSYLAVTANADNREPIRGFSTRTRNYRKSGSPRKSKRAKEQKSKRAKEQKSKRAKEQKSKRNGYDYNFIAKKIDVSVDILIR